MATVTEKTLRQRLARVRALERGATTPGERTAAARARERLMARIVEIRSKDPVARFVAAHVASLGVRPARPAPPERLPTERELVAVLVAWRDGDWDRDEVAAWAGRLVDRVVLPERSDAPDAAIAEVLLQLAMLHRVALGPDDAGAIRRFLKDRDWGAWFSLVANASMRRAAAG